MRGIFAVSVLLAASVSGQTSSFASIGSSVGSSGSSAASSTGSASASAPSASASGGLLAALQANPSTSALASALANTNAALGVRQALNNPSYNLTIFAPPASYLQALSSNTLLMSTMVSLNGTNVTLADAVLANHVLNASYPVSAITQSLMNGKNGFSLSTFLPSSLVDIYGFIASPSTQPTMSASASGSSSASSSSGSNAQSKFFVNNALITSGNAIQSGGSVVHLIDRPIDPLFPLVGVAEIPSSGGQDIVPPIVGFASTISVSNQAVSSQASATSSGSMMASSMSAASVSAAPLGPIGTPSSSSASSATMRQRARWA